MVEKCYNVFIESFSILSFWNLRRKTWRDVYTKHLLNVYGAHISISLLLGNNIFYKLFNAENPREQLDELPTTEGSVEFFSLDEVK